jgi:myo-inositol-1(or 4)-monophosphatase
MTNHDELERIAVDTGAVVDEAVALALQMLRQPFRDWRKGDRSPVTEIDLAVDRLLADRLPTVKAAAWLSEETADRVDRLSASRVWIVDPIDGTRSLIDQTPEFCVSVALVEDGEPIVGVVANPLSGERFWGWRGGGAYDGSGTPLAVRRWSASPRSDDGRIELLVSQTELRRGLWRDLEDRVQVSAVSSLAYKLAKVARGDVDATMTPWPRSEWDAAAGDLLIREAGGASVDIHGDALRYNRSEPVFEGVVAGSAGALAHLAGLSGELHRRKSEVLRAYQGTREG